MPKVYISLIRGITRLYPFLSGRGTLVQLPPLSWLRFREKRLTVELNQRFKIYVFPNDFIGKSLYFFRDVDPKIIKTLRQVIDPGEVFIDIGSNIGSVAFQCLDLVGESGRIIAVEPDPTCCESIRDSVALNRVENIEIFELALSDQNGEADLMASDPGNLGTMSVNPSMKSGGKRATVRLINAGEFLEGLEISSRYSVKIDVEGHEENVIRGAIQYFRENPPKSIVFEENSHVYSAKNFFKNPSFLMLRDLGYEVFEIQKSLLRMRYRDVNKYKVMNAQPTGTDFLAISHEYVPRIKNNIVD